MSRRLRRALVNIGIATCSVLLTLLGVEGILRLNRGDTIFDHGRFRRLDPVVHHGFIPNARGRLVASEFDTTYHINSLGLRGEERSLHKPPGVFRILMLGDSFTEGFGVSDEQTFSVQLEQLLRREPTVTKTIEVINGGMAGYSPLVEYVYLKKKGLDLSPDLVVLNVDQTDIRDDYLYSKVAVFDEQGLPISVPGELQVVFGHTNLLPRLPAFRTFLLMHFQVFGWMERAVHRMVVAWTSPTPFQIGDIENDMVGNSRDGLPSDWGEHYRRTEGYLQAMNALLESRGIRFVIAVYPWGHQVSADEWSDGRSGLYFAKDTVYTGHTFRFVEDVGKRHRIPVINALAAFRGSRLYPKYYPADPHFTPLGHQLYAEVLYQQLVRFGLMRWLSGESGTGCDAGCARSHGRDPIGQGHRAG